jgi:hypothetical protein
MDPKPLPYVGRLQKAQRLIKSAIFRNDQKLAVRELCEALEEITKALLDREQGVEVPPAPPNAGKAV